jgi:hypothetical protein
MSDVAEIKTAKPAKNKGGRPRKVRVEAASDTPSPAEIAFWDSVKSSRDPEDIELYLEKFPEGFFAGIAERRKTQCLLAQASGGAPEEQKIDGTLSRRRPTISMPPTPEVEIFPGEEQPRYQLLEPFFAENHTWYPVDKVITYLGPPSESMLPMNETARRLKRVQEAHLNDCHAIKCRAEGIPVTPRPKELADQMEADLAIARQVSVAQRGVQEGTELPPSRPDLARPGAKVRNPRAARVAGIEDGAKFSDRANTADIPILGTEGHRYQRRTNVGGMGEPLPTRPGEAA